MHVSIALHVFCWACTSKSQLMAINVQYKGMFSSFVWHERREVLKWEGTLCEFLGLYSYLKGILQNSDFYILELEKGISLLLPSCYSLVTYTEAISNWIQLQVCLLTNWTGHHTQKPCITDLNLCLLTNCMSYEPCFTVALGTCHCQPVSPNIKQIFYWNMKVLYVGCLLILWDGV